MGDGQARHRWAIALDCRRRGILASLLAAPPHEILLLRTKYTKPWRALERAGCFWGRLQSLLLAEEHACITPARKLPLHELICQRSLRARHLSTRDSECTRDILHCACRWPYSCAMASILFHMDRPQQAYACCCTSVHCTSNRTSAEGAR